MAEGFDYLLAQVFRVSVNAHMMIDGSVALQEAAERKRRIYATLTSSTLG
jgi:hypothetical protein